jgi:hypothetical protein
LSGGAGAGAGAGGAVMVHMGAAEVMVRPESLKILNPKP